MWVQKYFKDKNSIINFKKAKIPNIWNYNNISKIDNSLNIPSVNLYPILLIHIFFKVNFHSLKSNSFHVELAILSTLVNFDFQYKTFASNKKCKKWNVIYQIGWLSGFWKAPSNSENSGVACGVSHRRVFSSNKKPCYIGYLQTGASLAIFNNSRPCFADYRPHRAQCDRLYFSIGRAIVYVCMCLIFVFLFFPLFSTVDSLATTNQDHLTENTPHTSGHSLFSIPQLCPPPSTPQPLETIPSSQHRISVHSFTDQFVR